MLKLQYITSYESLWTDILGAEPCQLNLTHPIVIENKTVSVFRITSDSHQFIKLVQEMTSARKPRLLTGFFLNPSVRVEAVLAPDCPEVRAAGLTPTPNDNQHILNIIFISYRVTAAPLPVPKERRINTLQSTTTTTKSIIQSKPREEEEKEGELRGRGDTHAERKNSNLFVEVVKKNDNKNEFDVGKVDKINNQNALDIRKMCNDNRYTHDDETMNRNTENDVLWPDKSPDTHTQQRKENVTKESNTKKNQNEMRSKPFILDENSDDENSDIPQTVREKNINTEPDTPQTVREQNINTESDTNHKKKKRRKSKPFKWDIKRFIKRSYKSGVRLGDKKTDNSPTPKLDVTDYFKPDEFYNTNDVGNSQTPESRNDWTDSSTKESKSFKASGAGNKVKELLKSNFLDTFKLWNIFSLRDSSKPDLIKPSMLKKTKKEKSGNSASGARGSNNNAGNAATPDLLKSSAVSQKRKYGLDEHTEERENYSSQGINIGPPANNRSEDSNGEGVMGKYSLGCQAYSAEYDSDNSVKTKRRKSSKNISPVQVISEPFSSMQTDSDNSVKTKHRKSSKNISPVQRSSSKNIIVPEETTSNDSSCVERVDDPSNRSKKHRKKSVNDSTEKKRKDYDCNLQMNSDLSCKVRYKESSKNHSTERETKDYEYNVESGNDSSVKPKNRKRSMKCYTEQQTVNNAESNTRVSYTKMNAKPVSKSISRAHKELNTKRSCKSNTEAHTEINAKSYSQLNSKAYTKINLSSKLGSHTESHVAIKSVNNDAVQPHMRDLKSGRKTKSNDTQPLNELLNPNKQLRVIVHDVMEEPPGFGICMNQDTLKTSFNVSRMSASYRVSEGKSKEQKECTLHKAESLDTTKQLLQKEGRQSVTLSVPLGKPELPKEQEEVPQEGTVVSDLMPKSLPFEYPIYSNSEGYDDLSSVFPILFSEEEDYIFTRTDARTCTPIPEEQGDQIPTLTDSHASTPIRTNNKLGEKIHSTTDSHTPTPITEGQSNKSHTSSDSHGQSNKSHTSSDSHRQSNNSCTSSDAHAVIPILVSDNLGNKMTPDSHTCTPITDEQVNKIPTSCDTCVAVEDKGMHIVVCTTSPPDNTESVCVMERDIGEEATAGLGLTVTGLGMTENGLGSTEDGLGSTVTGLSLTEAGLGSKEAGLSSTVSGLDSTVTGLSSTVTGLSSSVSDLDSAVRDSYSASQSSTLNNETYTILECSNNSMTYTLTNTTMSYTYNPTNTTMSYTYNPTNATMSYTHNSTNTTMSCSDALTNIAMSYSTEELSNAKSSTAIETKNAMFCSTKCANEDRSQGKEYDAQCILKENQVPQMSNQVQEGNSEEKQWQPPSESKENHSQRSKVYGMGYVKENQPPQMSNEDPCKEAKIDGSWHIPPESNEDHSAAQEMKEIHEPLNTAQENRMNTCEPGNRNKEQTLNRRNIGEELNTNRDEPTNRGEESNTSEPRNRDDDDEEEEGGRLMNPVLRMIRDKLEHYRNILVNGGSGESPNLDKTEPTSARETGGSANRIEKGRNLVKSEVCKGRNMTMNREALTEMQRERSKATQRQQEIPMFDERTCRPIPTNKGPRSNLDFTASRFTEKLTVSGNEDCGNRLEIEEGPGFAKNKLKSGNADCENRLEIEGPGFAKNKLKSGNADCENKLEIEGPGFAKNKLKSGTKGNDDSLENEGTGYTKNLLKSGTNESDDSLENEGSSGFPRRWLLLESEGEKSDNDLEMETTVFRVKSLMRQKILQLQGAIGYMKSDSNILHDKTVLTGSCTTDSNILHDKTVLTGSCTTPLSTDSNTNNNLSANLQQTLSQQLSCSRATASQISPSLQQSPTLQKSPKSQQTPTLQKSPKSQQTPTLQKSPTSQQTPTLQKSPNSQQTPTLQKSPNSQQTPTLQKSPNSQQTPSPKSTTLATSNDKLRHLSPNTPYLGSTMDVNKILFRLDESYEPKWWGGGVGAVSTSTADPREKPKLIHLFQANQQDVAKIKCLLLRHTTTSYGSLQDIERCGGSVLIHPNTLHNLLIHPNLRHMCNTPNIQFGVYNSLSEVLSGQTVPILSDGWLLLLHHSVMASQALGKVLKSILERQQQQESGGNHNTTRVYIPALTLKQCLVTLLQGRKNHSQHQDSLQTLETNFTTLIKCVKVGSGQVIACEGQWGDLGRPGTSTHDLVTCLCVIHRCQHYQQQHTAVLVDEGVEPYSHEQNSMYKTQHINSFVL
ncbi:hypothetical protein Pcinc_008943 [Petrolisthes cinctipes]|uniref:Uncharacterized protein n=1 Tax=Petrolisthes cinctipes TaxID=88211 RepID=A0AAE1G5M0_PETCI|nr:hypothetical protein Pcinc_008943 [Petrolisthes cinctipes]